MENYTKRNIQWFQTIIFKQTILFISILVPLVMLIFLIYSNYETKMKQIISEATHTRDKAFFDEIDSRFFELEYRILDIFDDGDMYMVSALWDTFSEDERITRITNIQTKLQWFERMENYVQDVSVYFVKQNLMMSPNIHKEINNKQTEALLKLTKDKSITITIENRVIYLYIRPSVQLASADPMFISKIRITDYQYRRIVNETFKDSAAESMLLINDEIYLNSFEEPEMKEAIYQHYISKKDSVDFLDSKGFEFIHNKNKYFCSLIRSNSKNIAWLTVRSYDEVFHDIEDFIEWIPWLVLLFLFIMFIFLIYARQFINVPLVILGKAFKRMMEGEYGHKVDYFRKDEFTVLYEGFNRMSIQLDENMDSMQKQHQEIQKAQLKQLQSQMDPHFLYNAFFMLRARLRRSDYTGAEEISDELGNYFMYITRNAKDYICLEDELNHAYAYIKIQHARFRNRFRYSVEPCPKQFKKLLVPRLLLQPVIENAMQYGFDHIESGGLLNCWFEVLPEILVIHVEESGSDITDEKVKEMNRKVNMNDPNMEVTSMININRRLKLYYGKDLEIRFEKSSLGGVHTLIELGVDKYEETEYVNC